MVAYPRQLRVNDLLGPVPETTPSDADVRYVVEAYGRMTLTQLWLVTTAINDTRCGGLHEQRMGAKFWECMWRESNIRCTHPRDRRNPDTGRLMRTAAGTLTTGVLVADALGQPLIDEQGQMVTVARIDKASQKLTGLDTPMYALASRFNGRQLQQEEYEYGPFPEAMYAARSMQELAAGLDEEREPYARELLGIRTAAANLLFPYAMVERAPEQPPKRRLKLPLLEA